MPKKILRTILHYLNLESDLEDFDKIHETIQKDINFRGTNLWILIFAIVVASVGLNMNSPAVIIGAMLISPLMGPINGMGYSIATYNFPLFRSAFRNFSFAVIASLAASSMYFAITPVSTAQSELLARTSPTIYDVLIALFGGLAGIVAISSKQKGNVIPGVAIATALMPPLCTAGYGLATMQFNFFFGAFYLFTINTVFIGISSVAFSQILKFPIRTVVEDAQKKVINRWISLIILVTLIPSIYFGYVLVQKEKFANNAEKYISSIRVFEGNYLLRNEINPSKKNITLVFGGNTLTDDHEKQIRQKAADFSLDDARINIQQGFSYSAGLSEKDNLKSEINRLTAILSEKEKQQDSLRAKANTGRELLQEIKPWYSQISSCSYSESLKFTDSTVRPEKFSIIIFTTKKPVSVPERDKINLWLKSRLKTNKIEVYFNFKEQ